MQMYVPLEAEHDVLRQLPARYIASKLNVGCSLLGMKNLMYMKCIINCLSCAMLQGMPPAMPCSIGCYVIDHDTCFSCHSP